MRIDGAAFFHGLSKKIGHSSEKSDRRHFITCLVLLHSAYRFTLPWCDNRSETYRDRGAIRTWQGL
jgi:hypothetical protein